MSNLRKCKVNGEVAIFHKWVDDGCAYLQMDFNPTLDTVTKIKQEFDTSRIVPSGCELKIIPSQKALIEFKDGHCDLVPIADVIFISNNEELMLNIYDNLIKNMMQDKENME